MLYKYAIHYRNYSTQMRLKCEQLLDNKIIYYHYINNIHRQKKLVGNKICIIVSNKNFRIQQAKTF